MEERTPLAVVGTVLAQMAGLVMVFVLGLSVAWWPTGKNAGPITADQARYLPAEPLAEKLLGAQLAARVVDVERRDYEGIPRYLVFYTRPQLTWPRLNGICATDVITVELDWFESGAKRPGALMHIQHVEAVSRFKAFAMPPGEPGTAENDRLQQQACAAFTHAADAFRAPDAGAAQWLALMEPVYTQPGAAGRAFPFRCDDFSGVSCTHARAALPDLKLNRASKVEAIDCGRHSGDTMNSCYRLTFPYAGTDDPEWELSLTGGIALGEWPPKIRDAALKHVPRPMIMY